MDKTQHHLCVMLYVTNACNLRCRYCFEIYKNPQRMTLETGKEIIRNIVAEKKYDNLKIEFFGGEPFLNFPFVKSLCEWCWSEYPDVPFDFFTTTNGTLITEEVKEWLIGNKDRFVGSLSLDGTPEMQKINRGACIPPETIRLFRELWPKQGVNMTVSQETLPLMFEGIKYIHSFNFTNFKATLARGPHWTKEDVGIFQREMDLILNFYLSHPEIPPFDAFRNTLVPLLNEEMVCHHCGAGKTMRAYDTKGNAYPCHVFAPNSLAKEAWEQIRTKDLQADNSFLHDYDCRRCSIRNVCTTCVGENYKLRGGIGNRDRTLCPFFIIKNISIAKYKVQTICRKPFDEITERDYLELKASQQLLEANHIEL